MAGRRFMTMDLELFLHIFKASERPFTLEIIGDALASDARPIAASLVQVAADAWQIEVTMESDEWEPEVDRFGRPARVQPVVERKYIDAPAERKPASRR